MRREHEDEQFVKVLMVAEKPSVAKMMAEAVSREETKLAVKDPLKFWFSQVRYAAM